MVYTHLEVIALINMHEIINCTISNFFFFGLRDTQQNNIIYNMLQICIL